MELPLSPAALPEEPMFRSESWVRERSTNSYGRGIVIVVVSMLGIAAVFFAIRFGWAAKVFESGHKVVEPVVTQTPAAGVSSSDVLTTPPQQEATPAAPAQNAPTHTKSDAASAPSAAVPPGGQEFIVQVAAMRVRENADALANRLQAAKFPALQFTGRESLHIVAVGPFPDEASARTARQQLHAIGIDGMIRNLPAR
jgi:cell division septation protein DedD